MSLEDAGALAGGPVMTVDLDGRQQPPPVPPAQTPVVIVGVSTATAPPQPLPGCDVLLTTTSDPPAPWVCADPEALAVSIQRNPHAATTLAQVLRAGAQLDVAAGLVLESLAYATLQAGPEHQHWLAEHRRRPASASDEPPVLVERDGEILNLTLNRPARRNAYDAATRDGLAAGLDVAASDPTVTGVVLAGRGPSFCAGGDLDEFGTTPDPATAHLVRTTRSVAARLAAISDRVTARVHGACVGAGVELPAFAGRVVADPAATFRLPEVDMGLVPGAGGTVSIPRRIGRQRTAWLALSGQPLDAPTACRWGLVDELGAVTPG
jgi:enoyl-CoA hydratase/carnithine racemase